ncbi:uncharacterized protein ARMOST_05831 [Armillaria ostoyae]|uniref:Uncharacterized protein n=1 Tax=Armillaria ostoyae TaxID=47428 RepID=A0A284R1B7_ARMOS|nr:uncharacterized protein ARMOST_05831 [Armillaria ostoyae]
MRSTSIENPFTKRLLDNQQCPSPTHPLLSHVKTTHAELPLHLINLPGEIYRDISKSSHQPYELGTHAHGASGRREFKLFCQARATCLDPNHPVPYPQSDWYSSVCVFDPGSSILVRLGLPPDVPEMHSFPKLDLSCQPCESPKCRCLTVNFTHDQSLRRDQSWQAVSITCIRKSAIDGSKHLNTFYSAERGEPFQRNERAAITALITDWRPSSNLEYARCFWPGGRGLKLRNDGIFNLRGPRRHLERGAGGGIAVVLVKQFVTVGRTILAMVISHVVQCPRVVFRSRHVTV